MCQWDQIVTAVVADDRATAAELLGGGTCLAAVVRASLKGNRIDPEDVSQQVLAVLLNRWPRIRLALVATAGDRLATAGVPLLRWRVKRLALEAIRTADGLVSKDASLTATTEDGDGRMIDPAAPEDDTPAAEWAADVVWSQVPKLVARSRVFFKISMALDGSPPARTALTAEESGWRPRPREHPDGRPAGEVAAALAPLLKAGDPPAAHNEWLADRFRVASKHPADLIATWTSRAKTEHEELLVAFPGLLD